MGFIGVAEVGQVLCVRHIGFGDHYGIGLGALNEGSKQAYKFVGLGQIDTGGARLFPKERHGIKAKNAHPRIQQLANDFGEFLHHGGIAEIKINLVGAEGTPDRSLPGIRLHGLQQWTGSGTDHLGSIETFLWHKKIVGAGINAPAKIFKPPGAAGAVIEHQVCHHPIVHRQACQIGPVTQGLIDTGIVEDRKTVIRSPWVKGQYMHPGDRRPDPLGQKSRQDSQRHPARSLNGIAIGNQGDVPLVPQIPVRSRRVLLAA